MEEQGDKKLPEELDAAPAPPAEIAALPASDAPANEPSNKQQDKSNPMKKRKVAIFMSYVGHGYQGMQRNPGCKTIEDDLFRGITAAGGISEANSDDKGFSKVSYKEIVNY